MRGRGLRGIGPELVAGASDNDPTNVGTAVVVGARTGYQLSWIALLVAPLLAVVLAIAGEVGGVARADLQTLVRKRYGWRVAAVLLLSVVLVNMITIAADLQAGAAGLGLLTGVDPRWLVLPLGLGLAVLLINGGYQLVAAVLRFLLVGFAAFVAAAVLAHPDWPIVLRDSFAPSALPRGPALTGALALLGTTITSYVYIWETIQRGVEEPAGDGGPARSAARWTARPVVGAMVSAAFTSLILWSMIIASAATLGRHPGTALSAQAAAASLRPLAGRLAVAVFAGGLVVSAIVALPVLIACTGYVTGAQFDWRRGLSQPVRRARAFYAVLAASVLLAVVVTLAGISVPGMLYAASVAAGIGTPLGVALLVRLARDPQVMGARPISRGLAIAGWAVTALVAGLGLLVLVSGTLARF